MSRKVLVATEKPFAKEAVNLIKDVLDKASYELVLLENYTEKSELISAVEDVDALIIRSDKATSEVISNAKKLKIIVRAGAGYDNIDLAAATEKNVVAMNTPGQNSNAVAELVFGMMIYIARGCFNGKSGTELRNKSIGIHAYGNIGKYVALIAKGFGMDVYGFDPFVPEEVFKTDDVKKLNSVEELYEKCDYISLHLPKVSSTIKSINYDLMKKMKKNATLVNTARAEVIDEDGLLQMFENRPDFKYVSDVAPSCKETIIEKYAGRYYFTPKKMGAQTKEANINAAIAAANQIVNYFEKGDTNFQVNK